MSTLKCYYKKGKSITMYKDGNIEIEKSFSPIVMNIEDPKKVLPNDMKQFLQFMNNNTTIIYCENEIHLSDDTIYITKYIREKKLVIQSDEDGGINDIAIKYYGLPPHDYSSIEISPKEIIVNGTGVSVSGKDFDEVSEKLKEILPIYYKFETAVDDIFYYNEILFWRKTFSTPTQLAEFLENITKKYPSIKFVGNEAELKTKNGKIITDDLEKLSELIVFAYKLDSLNEEYYLYCIRGKIHLSLHPRDMYFYEDRIVIPNISNSNIETIRKIASIIPQFKWVLQYLDRISKDNI